MEINDYCVNKFSKEKKKKKTEISYLKLRPVVAGYKMESRSFFSESIIKTALHVTGRPSLFFSTGSIIPSWTARLRDSSAIIGYGKPSPSILE